MFICLEEISKLVFLLAKTRNLYIYFRSLQVPHAGYINGLLTHNVIAFTMNRKCAC